MKKQQAGNISTNVQWGWEWVTTVPAGIPSYLENPF